MHADTLKRGKVIGIFGASFTALDYVYRIYTCPARSNPGGLDLWVRSLLKSSIF